MKMPLREIRSRVVKSFRDIVVLAVLEENDGLNGYEIMEHIHDKLGILLPPSTLYATLYALEREMLVKGVPQSRARIYKITSKGHVKLEQVGDIVETFNIIMVKLCGNKAKRGSSI